jgi:tryptophanyl-tRNA synthetase
MTGFTECLLVFNLLSLFVSNGELDQIRQGFTRNEIESRQLRYLLFTNMNRELAPIRQKYHEIIKNPEYIDDLLRDGLLKVKRHSAGKERQILRKVGLSQ